MLNVYAAQWCPHCTQTVQYLNKNHIKFAYFEIESQPDDVVQQVVDANGGDDWVVPTLEYKGIWRPGKIFNEHELQSDLEKMGII